MKLAAKPWEPEANTRQRVVPLIAAVVIVAALVYAALPFTGPGGIQCSGALSGSTADPATPAGAIVGNPDRACADAGSSRRLNSGLLAAAALAVGLAAAFLPSDDDVEGEPPER